MEPKRRWVDEHWFWRGFQSAVFLYAQCGPCIAWRENHRQKKVYRREKKERARNPDHPSVIRQPAPHEINPHWAEEIRLGPSPPKRGRKRANTKAGREITSSGTMAESDTADSSKSELNRESKDNLPVFWNSDRYQRADEEYAYVDEKPEMIYAPPGLIRRGSSVGIGSWMADSKRLPEKPKRAYTPLTNMPPVNDLHPPVVSSVPSKREDRAWMTAPPPSTAFMHGKKGVTTRSRSGSGHSSQRNLDLGLSRQVVHKIVEEKMKNGETPNDSTDFIAPISARADSELQEGEHAQIPQSDRRSKSTSPFRIAREKEPIPLMKPRRRPSPLPLNTDKSSRSTSSESVSEVESDVSSSSRNSIPRGRSKSAHQLTRSKTTAKSALNSHPISPSAGKSAPTAASLDSLASGEASESSTLRPKNHSGTLTPPSSHNVAGSYDNSPRKRRDTKFSSDGAPLLVKDSSLHVLQGVVDPKRLLDNQWVKSPVVEARVPLPPDDSPHKENENPVKLVQVSAKEELLIQEGARRWSWGV
ncbi:uncharacterized protein PV09_05449 [Verruconis gallopava]|uniref:Uncharacterized protein n=1 Tax=Verruconis gallopava TaxID=253628 RepID=A0A0D2A9F3_9PEZI|nr:uncharacterized protein PV09_05449 [Verruconis gallopava]KIW03225.1 hypothetical protein PV09_05449 [Verruconis gallopava]